MHTLSAICALALLTLTSVGSAQISYHTATPGNEIWRVDHSTSTSALMSLPAIFATEAPNCILMTSPATGFVGTNPAAPATGNIYSIVVAGTTITLGNGGNALNTTALAGTNPSQLVELLGYLYFATQGGTGSGVLARIPVAGGPVEERLDTGVMTAPAVTGLANAVAKIGLKIYVGTFYSGSVATNVNEIIEHDPLGAPGNGTVALSFPVTSGKYIPTTSPFGIGIVNMQPYMIGTKEHLAVLGVYGDVLIVDVSTTPATVVTHYFTGRQLTPTTRASNLVNSFFLDPGSNDWVVGSRDGHVERIADGHSAEKIIVAPTGALGTSLGGTYYFPAAGNDDKSAGAAGMEPTECPGPDGYRLTDVATGPAVAPNPNFEFACYSGNGGDPYILGFGVALPATVNLLGCELGINPIVLFAGTLSGTGAGAGTASIPVAIPAGATVTGLARQWVAGSGATFVMSNVRVLNL